MWIVNAHAHVHACVWCQCHWYAKYWFVVYWFTSKFHSNFLHKNNIYTPFNRLDYKRKFSKLFNLQSFFFCFDKKCIYRVYSSKFSCTFFTLFLPPALSTSVLYSQIWIILMSFVSTLATLKCKMKWTVGSLRAKPCTGLKQTDKKVHSECVGSERYRRYCIHTVNPELALHIQ